MLCVCLASLKSHQDIFLLCWIAKKKKKEKKKKKLLQEEVHERRKEMPAKLIWFEQWESSEEMEEAEKSEVLFPVFFLNLHESFIYSTDI